MSQRAVIDAMRWRGNKDTIFHVVNRSTGKETKICYKADPFFFLVRSRDIPAQEKCSEI